MSAERRPNPLNGSHGSNPIDLPRMDEFGKERAKGPATLRVRDVAPTGLRVLREQSALR